ncbi:MAG TPA: general secretion pathway protein GspB, partial [Roseateles sp.]
PAASASPYLPPVVAAAPAPAPAAEPAPPPPAEARIPRLAELPENTRRELPRLAISGSVYSDDPASRFVIVNGEVQREGAKLGADLVLEQIGARELVLRFKGQRFRQPV